MACGAAAAAAVCFGLLFFFGGGGGGCFLFVWFWGRGGKGLVCLFSISLQFLQQHVALPVTSLQSLYSVPDLSHLRTYQSIFIILKT